MSPGLEGNRCATVPCRDRSPRPSPKSLWINPRTRRGYRSKVQFERVCAAYKTQVCARRNRCRATPRRDHAHPSTATGELERVPECMIPSGLGAGGARFRRRWDRLAVPEAGRARSPLPGAARSEGPLRSVRSAGGRATRAQKEGHRPPEYATSAETSPSVGQCREWTGVLDPGCRHLHDENPNRILFPPRFATVHCRLPGQNPLVLLQTSRS
jgi:hypothetical protein